MSGTLNNRFGVVTKAIMGITFILDTLCYTKSDEAILGL